MLTCVEKFLTSLYRGTKILPSYLINQFEDLEFEDRHAIIAAIDDLCDFDNEAAANSLPVREIESISLIPVQDKVKVKINLCS